MNIRFLLIMQCLLIPMFTICIVNSYACGCTGYVDFKDAKEVFVGKVLSIKDKDGGRVKIKVIEVNKGEITSKKVWLQVPCFSDGCCGIAFKKGHVYKVFTFKERKGYYTNQCSQTHQIEE